MFDTYARKPAVFISSTCYDLKQIRADIKRTLEDDMGFDVVMSEFDSFPLNPSLGTLENCLRVVEHRADILILIIGGKYGFITDSGKSITNLEYLQAKEKGIPIYIFINKSILSSLPLWQDNPNVNFSSLVDTNSLFAFVEELMDKDRRWVYEYESAQDICNTLKNQFSYLFHDSLKMWEKFNHNKLSTRVLEQSAAAIKYVLEKKDSIWEYRFFFQVLWDKLDQLEDYKRDLKYKVYLNPSNLIEEPLEILSWITNKTTKLMQCVDSLSSLINEAIPVALGEPGIKSDLDFLVYIATRISEIYQKIIDWEIDVQAKIVSEDAVSLVKTLTVASQTVITEFDKLIMDSKEKLGNVPSIIPSGETYVIDLRFTINSPDFSEFNLELECFKNKIIQNNMLESE
ncbi:MULTISPECIES: DUF4062 domain-containing protein [Enterococcus]|uniref:DUF4062 domain-containing protein n=1 Tax=Enterococcus TaxID=1350 RepID=UPI002891BE91|nr:DUF4062 domain-containing protein [Enterococcus thailandicus]MDT2752018.1 DUF4062 domain-containing protein [Enterococcus thailandicus]MDT2777104.1 DUF4062 domain-containing protein [Enterococcus thailandicus]